MKVLTDPFQRRLSYLRLSVTDLCNYRCSYCLPQGYRGKAKPDELTLAEIRTLLAAFAQSGTRKVRLTGGEASLRRDLPDIIAACRARPEITRIALTTNAHRLGKWFPACRAAGLDAVNVSLDSFRPEVFRRITGKNACESILADVEQLMGSGFYNIKINTLLLREHADDTFGDALDYVRSRPLVLRFIELMQTGGNDGLFREQHLSAAVLERRLLAEGWQLVPQDSDAGPAREYRHRDFAGGIGFIAPYGKDFCNHCNRLRVSAQGRMHLCLFGGEAHDLRPWLRSGDAEALAAHLHGLVVHKPEHHFLHDKNFGMIRDLSVIGG